MRHAHWLHQATKPTPDYRFKGFKGDDPVQSAEPRDDNDARFIGMVRLHSLDDGDINKEGSVNEDCYSIDPNMSLTSLIDSEEYDRSMAEYNSEGEEMGDDLPPLHECYVNTPNHGDHRTDDNECLERHTPPRGYVNVNFEVPYKTNQQIQAWLLSSNYTLADENMCLHRQLEETIRAQGAKSTMIYSKKAAHNSKPGKTWPRPYGWRRICCYHQPRRDARDSERSKT